MEQYLRNYHEQKPHRLKRIVWLFVNCTLFRLLVGPVFKKSRVALVRLFGAEIGTDSDIFPTANIFAPWNLKMGDSCIGPRTNIYNKALVRIGDRCVISQDTTLCSASHDISDEMFQLVVKPIVIKDYAWVAAEAFVGMGVTIGEGAVVGARAAVFKDVEPWTVVGGNPAKYIKKRIIKE